MLALQHFSEYLQSSISDQRIIISIIGVLSAIVDNVPLVAASMGMYSLETYPMDHFIWEYLAYCAGTGGSLLIIGSAAGVAAMGMEKIEFVWYAKKISWLALIGYAGGAVVFLLMNT
jgi:Na+/H+ antiporter NhaD/arsenite permease-like protein